ncbi:MAG TPA: TetR/AcrR family transcriptional regulator [Acidimicrobiales bacterium]|nr:TetR/AcrR family transcriptional regulator [Acidimicrobiales bacterium]
MPKVVDRTERREEVLEAAWRLMARVGIDRVSIREIAAEAGYSTGVIAHYFKNKDDVLLSALQLVNSQEIERVACSTAGMRGLAAVRTAIEEVLPVGEERQLEMTVWMSFWGRAVGDERLAAIQRRSYGEWRSLLRGHLEEAVADREVRSDLDCADEAARTAALIDGLGIQAMLEPERMTARKVVDIMDSHLRSLKEPAGVLPTRALDLDLESRLR